MATRADVAKLAEVSASTVSYALNGKRSIKAETRERVLDAVAKLNYSPHVAAGVLAGGKPRSVALIFPSYGGNFSSLHLDYVQGVIDGAKSRNYHVIVWPQEEVSIQEIVQFKKSGLIAGVILMEIMENDKRVKAFAKEKIPFVMIGRTKSSETLKYVDRDFEKVAEIAAEYLASLGHKKIAVLTQKRMVESTVISVDERFTQAVKKYTEKFGLTANFLVGENSIASGGSFFVELFKRPKKVSAVIGLTDLATLGFVNAARAAGISIPSEISVLGLNTQLGQIDLISPALTSIYVPAKEMGNSAVNILIDELNEESGNITQQLLVGHLVVAKSTGQAPK